jgi:hypothetical protein
MLIFTENMPESHVEPMISAVDFYMTKLVSSKRILKKLEITVIYVPILEKQGYAGFCIPIPSSGKRPPNEFQLLINPVCRINKILLTTAHECVHIEQQASGRLEMFGAGNARWQGTPYVKSRRVNYDDFYWDCPWEIEAHGRELGLHRRFIENGGTDLKRLTRADIKKYGLCNKPDIENV